MIPKLCMGRYWLQWLAIYHHILLTEIDYYLYLGMKEEEYWGAQELSIQRATIIHM